MDEPDEEPQTVRFGDAWLTWTKREPHTVVAVGGELFIYEAPGLRRQLLRAIAEDDGDLILVTRDVTYFDATCVGVLIGSMHRLQQPPSRRALRVVDSGLVAKILRATGLTNVIGLHNTVAEAQQAGAPRPTAAGVAPV